MRLRQAFSEAIPAARQVFSIVSRYWLLGIYRLGHSSPIRRPTTARHRR